MFGNKTIKNISFCPPYHESKGVIARKCAHMISTNPTVKGDLIIPKHLMEEWMYKYPVTEEEKVINDIIFELQGNENKFIV